MKLCLLLLLQLLFVSCNRGEKQTLTMLKTWIGKEIIYPKGMIFTIQGNDTLSAIYKDKYSYVIMNYIDSTGCTSCKLQIPRWQNFIEEILVDDKN